MSKKNILNWQSHGHTCLAFICSHDGPVNYTDLDYDFLKFKGDTEIGAPFFAAFNPRKYSQHTYETLFSLITYGFLTFEDPEVTNQYHINNGALVAYKEACIKTKSWINLTTNENFTNNTDLVTVYKLVPTESGREASANLWNSWTSARIQVIHSLLKRIRHSHTSCDFKSCIELYARDKNNRYLWDGGMARNKTSLRLNKEFQPYRKSTALEFLLNFHSYKKILYVTSKVDVPDSIQRSLDEMDEILHSNEFLIWVRSHLDQSIKIFNLAKKGVGHDKHDQTIVEIVFYIVNFMSSVLGDIGIEYMSPEKDMHDFIVWKLSMEN